MTSAANTLADTVASIAKVNSFNFIIPSKRSGYFTENSRRRFALLTTVIEDSAIAAPATTGLSKNPNAG
ncbi:hypothetical protein OFC62_24665, partial [Escherichia coli]|nr:hypothetical protein [Escherichia coli]